MGLLPAKQISELNITHVKGKLLVSDGTAWNELAVGTNNQVLTADSAEVTGLKWGAGGSSNSFETWTIDNTDTEYTWAGTDGDIVADSSSDTVTLVAGTNITLDRDATSDAIRITASGGGASWTKVTKAYTDFTAAATSEAITLFTLAAGDILRGIVIKHTTAFAGTGITAYTLEVGTTGESNRYAEAFDVFQAVGNTTLGVYQNFDIQNWGAGSTIEVTARSTGGNLSAGTAGAVEIYYLTETVKS